MKDKEDKAKEYAGAVRSILVHVRTIRNADHDEIEQAEKALYDDVINPMVKAGFEAGKQERERVSESLTIETIDHHFLKTYDMLQEMGFKASNAELFLIVKSVLSDLENLSK
jgi:hypothetical protein